MHGAKKKPIVFITDPVEEPSRVIQLNAFYESKIRPEPPAVLEELPEELSEELSEELPEEENVV